MAVFKKQVNVQCGIQCWYPHNAANHAIAKNSWWSYFQKFEVLFSRNLFLHFLPLLHNGNDFSSGWLSFDISTKIPSLAQYRWKVIIYNLVKSKELCHQMTISYFWVHTPILQGPFTRWVNNKLKENTSHLYFIFSITFKSTLLLLLLLLLLFLYKKKVLLSHF